MPSISKYQQQLLIFVLIIIGLVAITVFVGGGVVSAVGKGISSIKINTRGTEEFLGINQTNYNFAVQPLITRSHYKYELYNIPTIYSVDNPNSTGLPTQPLPTTAELKQIEIPVLGYTRQWNKDLDLESNLALIPRDLKQSLLAEDIMILQGESTYYLKLEAKKTALSSGFYISIPDTELLARLI